MNTKIYDPFPKRGQVGTPVDPFPTLGNVGDYLVKTSTGVQWLPIPTLKTLYVDASNASAGDGSVLNPFKTIDGCMQFIYANNIINNTIKIAGGVYTFSYNMATGNTIQCENGVVCTYNGVATAFDSNLSNLPIEINGGRWEGSRLLVSNTNHGSSIVLNNASFNSTSYSGSVVFAGYLNAKNCSFYNPNTSSVIKSGSFAYPCGIYLTDSRFSAVAYSVPMINLSNGCFQVDIKGCDFVNANYNSTGLGIELGSRFRYIDIIDTNIRGNSRAVMFKFNTGFNMEFPTTVRPIFKNITGKTCLNQEHIMFNTALNLTASIEFCSFKANNIGAGVITNTFTGPGLIIS